MKHLAVVGCGRVLERYYLPALRGSADWRLVAAIDSDPARRRWIEAMVPGVGTYEALAAVPPSLPLDAALIATPPASHAALATEVLQRSAHVFLEKPMTPRHAEAETVVRLAGERGRQVWVGFNRRFRESYGTLRERLRRLPKEHIVSIDYDLRSDSGGWRPVSPYLGDDERGGGVLDDIASHQLDLIPWLLDARVTAVSASHDPQAPAGTAVSIRLRLGGGLEAQCRAGHTGPAVERLEIRLDRGALLATRGTAMRTGPLPMAAARPLAAVRDSVASATGRLAGRPNVTVGSFRRQLAEWARALESGHSTTAADGSAGARCVALVEACRESLARGGAWQEPPLFAKV